ncbi:sugar-phosphate nucleotidyltransferase [Erysipelothrix sp. HDW6C]|uniref:sugar-phosphate nucleotidyltransferase n=1 Tax=Erysipelothrix sp. HDW6C TaxID=2714930 RepID=UPI00140E2A51|nr:sugar-phosphate nucleotidyltransferase [Erysipelothrix sp. HDW6C]QIK70859.1 sugar-phosphate nucleotidyltransferase [Erysipelothrix sp. HDW6C]
MNQKQRYDVEKQSNPDHVATPRYVVEEIYKLIHVEQFKQIWFPFNNYDSEFKLKAEELKLQYTATHLFDDLGNDFYFTLPPEGCDLMISNPPFSEQNHIIERSFALVEQGLIKSFVLLLPNSTTETPTRGRMWEYHKANLSIIYFNKRIRFKGHKTSFNKGCVWMCYNIDGLDPLNWI